ncbi:hypothetical protein Ari01nite_84680 [Paractinoplanes rishiriensis]|uniref:Uncharacterized protein n=1 Tax=Paractinoplanes rishiriensis TaxID=1050105 RepID=A0A919MZ39_9ACTN|nr:hypothetical protein Ari01nite_84680 [Actinoplanes rishiriensis]
MLAVAIATAVIGGTIGLQNYHSSADPEKPPPAPPAAPFLVAADAHGSVVFDLSREVILGYDRAGKLAWQDEAMAKNAYITCVAACPDVVASGSLSDQGPEARQATIVRADGRFATRPAADADVVLLQRDDRNRVVLERRLEGTFLASYQKGKLTQRLAMANPRMPRIAPGSAGSMVIASRAGSSATVYFVARSGTGWTIKELADRGASGGCTGPASSAVVYPDRAVVVDQSSGRKQTVQQDHIGTCHVAGDGLLAETTSVGPSGHRSLVRYWDVRSGTGWTMEGTETVNASLDPSGTRAVVVQGTVATIRAGADQQVIQDVVDARYAEDGSLVLLHADATVTRR